MSDASTLHPATDIRVYEETLPGSLFERLVRAVRLVGDERLKKNYTTTFWMPMETEPRNVAEEAFRRASAKFRVQTRVVARLGEGN